MAVKPIREWIDEFLEGQGNQLNPQWYSQLKKYQNYNEQIKNLLLLAEKNGVEKSEIVNLSNDTKEVVENLDDIVTNIEQFFPLRKIDFEILTSVMSIIN